MKVTKQYWYPFRDIGGVKNANLDGAVNLDIEDGEAKFGFYITEEQPDARVVARAGSRMLFEKAAAMSPAKPFVGKFSLPSGVAPRDVKVALLVGDRELISYQPVQLDKKQLPETVKPPPPPDEIKTIEELYLTGLRLEQFYNPAMEPYPYYEEALRRDPDDYRVNTQLGLLYLKRGMFGVAEKHLQTAVDRASRNYTRPKDGEALYYLGVALKAQGKLDQAVDPLERAAWSYAWSSPANHVLAEIAGQRGDWVKALAYVNRSLSTNARNTTALNLKAAVLRRLGRDKTAARPASRALSIDPLDFFATNELHLLSQSDRALKRLTREMRDDDNNYLELAVSYGNAGMWEDAIAVVDRRLARHKDRAKAYPMLHYFKAYFQEKNDDADGATKSRRLAANAPPDFGFPYRMEALDVLGRAMQTNPSDARASYYLGNLLFDHQPEAALDAWEKSREIDDGFATIHRNLGLAYARVGDQLDRGIASLEKAVELARDPRALFELDELYERAGRPASERLAVLEKHQGAVSQRDDALSREIELLVLVGQYDRALELLANRHFRKWEGVGSVHSSYVSAHLLRGHAHFQAKRFDQALEDSQRALEFPPALESAKGYRDGSLARPYYYVGRAHAALGQKAEAAECWRKSIAGAEEALELRKPSMQDWASILYYKGLSLAELGRKSEAKKIFTALVRTGKENQRQAAAVDYFAKFGERGSREAGLAQAHYLTGLGHLAMGKNREAQSEFRKAVSLDANHLMANFRLSTGSPR